MKKYLLICILTIICYHISFAQNDSVKEDLLEQFTGSRPDTNRLNILIKLIDITYLDPKEQIHYIDRLLEEAEKQNSDYYKCRGYLYYMYQGYNRYDGEEVNKWVKLLEPLALKGKFYDLYFRGKQCVIDMLLLEEQYELEEQEAIKMLKEAERLKNIGGQMMAYHSLAHVYMRTYRGEKAFEVLEKAIFLGPLYDNKLRYSEVLRTMTINCQDRKDLPNWFKYLEKRDSLLFVIEREFPTESFEGERLLNNISYLHYYIACQRWDIAALCLEKIEDSYSEKLSPPYKYYYRSARYYYYADLKDWTKALQEVDHLLELLKNISEVDYANELVVKAKVLNIMNKNQEALQVYKQAKILKDSLSISTINKQAEQLKNSYKSDLQILSAVKQKQRIQQVFLVLACIIIITLLCSVIHALRVKRKLTKAEQEMREMMNETEQANKIKERFLANINMTIRPPLDIIVKNSSRLASEEEIAPREKEKLAELITSTSSRLMELINEILMLSKLEANMMKYTIREINIIEIIQNIIEIIRQKEAEKIQADIPSEYEVKINGDENYLKQVINSICKKSLYTDKSITLKFERVESGKLNIIFGNTMLATPDPSQETIISNEINRMLLENFGGKYSKSSRGDIPCIILTFNV